MTWRQVRRIIGWAGLALAVYLVAWTNVDVLRDHDHGSSSCGPNAISVLLNGPSRNRDVLTVADCRRGAAFNLSVCLGLALVSVLIAYGRSPRALRGWLERDAQARATGRFRTEPASRIVGVAAAAVLALSAAGLLAGAGPVSIVVGVLAAVASAWLGRRVFFRPGVTLTAMGLSLVGASRRIEVIWPDVASIGWGLRGIEVHRRAGPTVVLPVGQRPGRYQQALLAEVCERAGCPVPVADRAQAVRLRTDRAATKLTTYVDVLAFYAALGVLLTVLLRT